jgi:RNA polymerase sigma-70 factor (TIGR02943 family)
MKQSVKNIGENPQDIIKEWVQLFTHSLYAWACYKVSDKTTAEDLVQETFLSAYQSLGNFRSESSPKTWLFSILNHKIVDHLRKKMKDPMRNEGSIGLENYFDRWEAWNKEARPQEWTATEQELLDNPEFRNALQQCMQRLPGKWGAAVQLKYLEEKEGTAICQDLEISPSNFWQILHRAKLQLRKCLELHWFKK